MATTKRHAPSPPAAKRSQAADSRGNIRIYADVPEHVAEDLAIMAIRKKLSKKDMLAQIITEAVQTAR